MYYVHILTLNKKKTSLHFYKLKINVSLIWLTPSVFPEPVCAIATKSLPLSAIGHPCA